MPAARPSSAAASVSASKWPSGEPNRRLASADLSVELGEPDGEEVAGQGLVVVRRGDLLDLVPELGEQAAAASTAATASRSGWALMADADGVPDPQRAGRARIASANGTGGIAPS